MSEIANALLPQFPCTRKYDRTDYHPHKAERLEAAKARHQKPDEAQMGSLTCDHGSHDLVATEQDHTTQPE